MGDHVRGCFQHPLLPRHSLCVSGAGTSSGLTLYDFTQQMVVASTRLPPAVRALSSAHIVVQHREPRCRNARSVGGYLKMKRLPEPHECDKAKHHDTIGMMSDKLLTSSVNIPSLNPSYARHITTFASHQPMACARNLRHLKDRLRGRFSRTSG